MFDKVNSKRFSSSNRSNGYKNLIGVSTSEVYMSKKKKTYGMNIDKTKFGNEEVDKIQCILVHFRAILRRGGCPGGEAYECRHELAEYQVH